ncbi:MAG: hypothetical protein Q8942_07575 [Bacillota bacterium]|nr:hypothetical protein [Bacillota bacterium]
MSDQYDLEKGNWVIRRADGKPIGFIPHGSLDADNCENEDIYNISLSPPLRPTLKPSILISLGVTVVFALLLYIIANDLMLTISIVFFILFHGIRYLMWRFN